jgi:hypothetical protein
MGKPLTNQEIGRLARELGHDQLRLESFGEGKKKGVRWTLYCSCGWHSRHFVLPDAAVMAGKAHLVRHVEHSLLNRPRDSRPNVGALR